EIKKNIGKIFKKHNIVEYKSEPDYLSIDDYYKVIAYGGLYNAFAPNVTIDQITLTFVEYKYPRKLLRHLREERKLKISNPYEGIYYIQGDVFPAQIIVNDKRLPETENIFLKSLRSDLTRVEIENVLKALNMAGRTEKRLTYIETLLRVNSKLIKEAYTVLKIEPKDSIFVKTVTQAFQELYEESGWLPDYMDNLYKTAEVKAKAAEAEAKFAKANAAQAEAAEAAIETIAVERAIAMIKDGLPTEFIVKYSVLPKDKIDTLASNFESESAEKQNE
ncbi:MAG: hypothetical protein LBS84_11160, partial [Clostridiales bacterium]|nr:hypothetical protein [Clostridiales bacterium]